MPIIDLRAFEEFWANQDKSSLRKSANLHRNVRLAGGPEWPRIEQLATQLGGGKGKQVLDVADERPNIQVLAPKNACFGQAKAAKPRCITDAYGGTFSAEIEFGVVAGLGWFGCTNGQKGYYFSGGPQFQSNISIGAGGEWTRIFGPPSDFQGVSLNVGIDVTIFGPISGEGRIVIGILNNPFRFQFLGFSLALVGGISVLPVNGTMELTGTGLFCKNF